MFAESREKAKGILSELSKSLTRTESLTESTSESTSAPKTSPGITGSRHAKESGKRKSDIGSR